MKPIKLVIKGLNSFIEEQVVDFDTLTDRGLFGIFGPTGSGKSTILDGITLALYGDIARKSSNYINTNCNDLNVSYQFQISGTVNRIYQVSRHFKRDKNTGNAKTHSASVIEYTADGPNILAEGATQVTKTCREILGLSLEDFTRTVVLPQGKFSEFLKLEGKNRREMLERLFNLQEYGDGLSKKLAKQISLGKEKDNQIIGELKGYEDISEDRLQESKDLLGEIEKELEQLKKEQQKAEQAYKENEEVWKLQKEIEGCLLKQKELVAQAQEMTEVEQKINRGESALRVYPSLQACEATKKNLQEASLQKDELEKKVIQLTKEKEELQIKFDAVSKEKEEKLPDLRDKSQQLQLVIEDNESIITTENELETIKVALDGLEVKSKGFIEEETRLAKALEDYQKQIVTLQEEQKLAYVEEVLRHNVQQGLMLTQRFELESNTLNQNEGRIKTLLEEKEQLEKQFALLKTTAEEQDEAMTKSLAEQEKLKNPPYTQEQLMKLQGEVTLLKEKKVRYDVICKELVSYEEQYRINIERQQVLQLEYDKQKSVFNETKAELEKLKIENMAIVLKQHLHVGDACPVCGGLVSHIEDHTQITNEKLQQLEIIATEQEAQLEMTNKDLSAIELQQKTNIESCDKLKNELAPIQTLFEDNSVEKAEELLANSYQAVKVYEENKQVFEQAFNKLKEENAATKMELGQKQIALAQTNKQLEAIELEVKGQRETLVGLEKQLDTLSKQLEGKTFAVIAQEIQVKDKKREELTNKLNELTTIKEETRRQKEELQEKINKYKASFQRGLAQFDEKQKNKTLTMKRMSERLREVLIMPPMEMRIDSSKTNITQLIKSNEMLCSQLQGSTAYISVINGASNEQEELSDMQQVDSSQILMQYPLVGHALNLLKEAALLLKNHMMQFMQEIEERFSATKKAQEEMTQQYDHVTKQLIEIKTNLDALEKRLADEMAVLEQGLKNEKLTVEEVRNYLLSKEMIDTLKTQINQYKEECSKLAGAMENAEKKLNGRRIEEEDWLLVQEVLNKINSETQLKNESYIKQSTVVKNMETALEKLGELRKEKEKLDHRMAILSDLDKLFKGKRFVEFVASNRLKYISIEASKKLKEITGGNYGLEVDEDGKFIVRDYKNGGAKRDASTLSGGETFLASLALALALSAEIQLKGTAPLELFFLDEGFGTLDDNLLEVVMSSLERIHHDKLKIGIISHVETIKNRIPVKLILTPAESGMGGTKVKLERS